MTKTMTAATTLLGMGAFAILGTVFQPEPTPLAVTTTADSSIGFPFMAWRVPDHPALFADGEWFTLNDYDFVRVYVGSIHEDTCIVVKRSTALNQERCRRAHNFVTGGWATLPIPKDETIQVSIDGTILIPKMRVRDMREVAYGH